MLDIIGDNIKNSIDIITLVEEYGVTLKRVGSVFVGLCPFHVEKTPSFTVYPNTRSFCCFGCKVGGDAFNFIKRIENVGFMEAKRILAEKANISLPQYSPAEKEIFQERALVEEIWTTSALYYYEQFNPTQRQLIMIEGQKFQEKYPITDESIQTFRIGFAPVSGDLFPFLKEKGYTQEQLLKTGLFIKTKEGIKDFFQGRIVFPYLKSGKAVYFIARKTDLTPQNSYEEGKYKKLLTYSDSLPYISKTIQNKYFYNEDALRGAYSLIITEGITDCICYHQLDFACISPGTTQFRKEDQERAEQLLQPVSLIYLSNDSEENESGIKGALETAEFLEKIGKRVRLILLPRPPEVSKIDPADFIKTHDKNDIQRLINTAPTPLEYHIKQIPQDCPERDLPDLLGPLIQKIAAMKKMEQNSYIRLLKSHLKFSKQEIREVLKQEQASKNLNQQSKALTLVESERKPIQEIFPELTLSSPLFLPARWSLSNEGLFVSLNTEDGEISKQIMTPEPFFIKSISQDLDVHTERLILTHKREGKWREISIPRGIVFDHRKIVQLADTGFPVTSLNAKAIVKFLAEFEALNIESLNKSLVVHGFGYRQGLGGERIFILPYCHIGTNDQILFEPKNTGDEIFYKALNPKGSLEVWKFAIHQCLPYPRVMFSLNGGLAALLLEPVELKQGFTINFWGDTSAGKTITMEIMMSPYGDPKGLVQSWDSTKNAAERLADCCNGIPVALDESQLVDSKVVFRILYMVVNGIGRSRASKGGGLQKTAKWLTVLGSTGENSLIETTNYKGAEARTISLYGSPWGAINKEMANKVNAIREMIWENHGHAVKPFVEEIFRRGNAALKKEYQEYLAYFSAKARNTGMDMRKAQYFAVILLAGKIAESLFAFGSEPEKICEQIWEETTAEEQVDYATKALRFVASWVSANKNNFDQVREEKTVEHGEIFGVINPGEYVAIFPHKLRDLLVKADFSPSGVLKEWKNREWIQTSPDQLTYQVQFRGERTRMTKLLWSPFYSSNE